MTAPLKIIFIFFAFLMVTTTFTSCTKEDQPPTQSIDNINTTKHLSSSAHWKNYIERIATTQDFDYLEVYDPTGKLLYHWHISELRFDLNAPQAVVLISKYNSTAILYDDILSITRVTDKTVSEQLMTKAEAY